jgi:hypothetical protein
MGELVDRYWGEWGLDRWVGLTGFSPAFSVVGLVAKSHEGNFLNRPERMDVVNQKA